MTINALDPTSIQEAINILENYEDTISDLTQIILSRLAKEAADIAQMVFDSWPQTMDWRGGESGVKVTWEQRDNGDISIYANGDQVCFLEFGTGVWAGSGYPFLTEASNIGVEVYPGSWSKDHAQTYQKWVAGGKKGEYLYNGKPAGAMVVAYERIKARFNDYYINWYKDLYKNA